MTTDAELLRRYADDRVETAFAELVRRHLDLVHSAALRRTNGQRHLAEEIAQKVFIDLSRKSAALKTHPSLTGWLYRTTRYTAIDALRSESRRQALAQNFQAMPNESTQPEASVDWDQVRPVLDEAMDQLKERDRELMLLRFFHGLNFVEVGQRLQLSENAARMRTERALEKLRNHLGRRGVTSTAAALGTLLANQAIAAAPAGLAAVVTSAAVTAGPATGLAGLTTIILMSKLTAPAVSALVAAGLTAIICTSSAKDLRPEIAALRKENVRLTEVTATSAPNAAMSSAADEFTAQAAAIAQAMERNHPLSTKAPVAASGQKPTAGHNGHRERGQATPHDALMSFTWASDAGEIAALSKLVCFDGKGREKALEILASMPDELRARYKTPEEFYAFLIAADALLVPPPAADVIENYEVVELSPGRVALRKPGSKRTRHQYQQTMDGWKYILPESAVADMPVQILNSEILTKLTSQ